MAEYTTYDFAESLDRAGVDPSEIKSVIAAWGVGQQSWADWEGGFLLHMKDDRYAYVWGWCDSSGWGCQDGGSVEYTPDNPGLTIKRGQPMWFMGYVEALTGPDKSKWGADWDEDPADLNLWLGKGHPAPYTEGWSD